MKHRYDLALLHEQDGVDIGKVAREILRTCRHHGIRYQDFDAAARRLFQSLDLKRMPAWEAEDAKRGTKIDFIEGFIFLGDTWHNNLSAHVTAEVVKIRTAEFVEKAAARRKLRETIVESKDNIIPFCPRGVA